MLTTVQRERAGVKCISQCGLAEHVAALLASTSIRRAFGKLGWPPA